MLVSMRLVGRGVVIECMTEPFDRSYGHDISTGLEKVVPGERMCGQEALEEQQRRHGTGDELARRMPRYCPGVFHRSRKRELQFISTQHEDGVGSRAWAQAWLESRRLLREGHSQLGPDLAAASLCTKGMRLIARRQPCNCSDRRCPIREMARTCSTGKPRKRLRERER